VEWDSPRFEELLGRMGKKKVESARAVILLDVWKVQTSCGYGVPIISNSSNSSSATTSDPWIDRKTLGHWAGQKVEKNELLDYQRDMNAYSHDGLPGLRSARRDLFHASRLRMRIDEILLRGKMIVRGQWEGITLGLIIGIMVGIFGRVMISI